MTKVEVTRKTTARVFRVSIDSVRLVFKKGKATRNLPAGKHAFSWTVIGNPGDTYEAKFTKPASPAIACSAVGTIDQDGFNFGACRFEVS